MYNIAGQTPCDVAAEARQLIIAKLLESKMVFMVSTPQIDHKLWMSMSASIIVQSQNGSDGGENQRKVIMSRARNRVSYSTGNGIAFDCCFPQSFHNTETLTQLRNDIIKQVAADLQVSTFKESLTYCPALLPSGFPVILDQLVPKQFHYYISSLVYNHYTWPLEGLQKLGRPAPPGGYQSATCVDKGVSRHCSL